MFPWPPCNTGNDDLCSLGSHVKHFLHSEGSIKQHMQYLTLLHSCFRTNRSVRRNREGHGGRGGSTCQVNRFKRANRRDSLSESVRNRCTVAAFYKSLTVLTVFLCAFLCVCVCAYHHPPCVDIC